jgi:hypothetical protein
MMETILDHCKPALKTKPYRYAVTPEALDPDYYQELLESRPSWQEIADVAKKQGENIRADIGYAQYPNYVLRYRRHMPQVWREFFTAHLSQRFYHQVNSLLGISPLIEELEYQYVPRGKRTKSTLPRIDLDCQIGVNTPTPSGPDRVRGPHVDNPIELWGAMLYMPVPGDDAGGDLIVYKSKIPIQDLRFIGKAELPDDVVEEVDRVPYEPNTAVFFENGLHCIHGVSERQATDQPRQLVNFIAEWREPLFALAR